MYESWPKAVLNLQKDFTSNTTLHILVNLTRSLFSEKMLISNKCICGLMSNLIKKSWTVSRLHPLFTYALFSVTHFL